MKTEKFETPAQSTTESIFQRLWTPVDAASFLRIHKKSVIRLARKQVIPAIRLGKHWRFRSADLIAWAADQVEFNSQPKRVMET